MNRKGMAPEAGETASRTTMEPISFSSDFIDEKNFISINPHSRNEEKEGEKAEMMKERVLKARGVAEFKFLSSNIVSGGHSMSTADELFFEGKLLPCWQMQQHSEKLNKIRLRTKDAMEDKDEEAEEYEKVVNKEKSRFVDDDPSPRPPKCTVLWKELLRLKKQRASSLSPSFSSPSSTSQPDIKLRNGCKEGSKHVKRIKIRKGMQRTGLAKLFSHNLSLIRKI